MHKACLKKGAGATSMSGRVQAGGASCSAGEAHVPPWYGSREISGVALTARDGRVLQQLAASHLSINHGVPVGLAVRAPVGSAMGGHAAADEAQVAAASAVCPLRAGSAQHIPLQTGFRSASLSGTHLNRDRSQRPFFQR